MNNTLKRLLTVIFLITVVSQACKDTSTGAIPVIDLAGSKSKIELAWSELAKDCRLIPLELHTNVVLPGKFNYWIGDKYLIINVWDSLLQFDLQGNFVRTLLRKGRGPGEFRDVEVFTVDEEKEHLYFVDVRRDIYLGVFDLKECRLLEKLQFDKPRASHLYVSDGGLLNGFIFDNKAPYMHYCIDPCSGVVRDTLVQILPPASSFEAMMLNPSFLSVLKDEIHFRVAGADTLFSLKDTIIRPLCTWKAENSLKMAYGMKKGITAKVKFEDERYLILNQFEWKITRTDQDRTSYAFSCQNNPLNDYVIDKTNFEPKTLTGFYIDRLQWKFEFLPDLKRENEKISMLIKAVEFREKVKEHLDQLSVEVKELYNQLNEDSNPVLVVGSAF